jgi:hypothetical protein
VKRIALTLALVFGAFLTLSVLLNLFSPADYRETSGKAECGTSDVMVLMAQAVPSATSVPCIATLPAGWKQGGLRIERGSSTLWLDSDRAGTDAVTVTLLPRPECRVTSADEVPSDEAGMRRFERPDRLPPHLLATRTYLFPGGCVTYKFAFDSAETASLLFDADAALAFQGRAELVETVRARNGLRLCGAFAPRCTGE